MQSHYVINVALNGLHLFATAPHSAVHMMDAEPLYQEIAKRFPPGEGFEVTVTHWECVGRSVPWKPRKPK